MEAGLFDDKNFQWGYGEENAFTHKILKLGYCGVLVRSVFIWHELSQTFGQKNINPKIDLQKVKQENIKKVIFLDRPKLVAYGRAKNEELIIEEQLRRLLSFCDEIVINDTGSTDNTVKIARSFDRVTVLESSDNIDYNAAHQLNAALSIAKSKSPDWLLYFDMDQFYDTNILYEIETLLNAEDVDIWSFRLYDGRFCSDWIGQQYNLDFICHTRMLCEPCYRVLPSLYRYSKDLIVAEPNDWNEWSQGEQNSGVSYPAEHCVLPIQYIDPDWRGNYNNRIVANTEIRHLGNCVSMEDLEKKKEFYTNHNSHGNYAKDWECYPLSLPREKLMVWKEHVGTEVDLGSNLVKYLNWDKDPALRKRFTW